MNTKVAFNILGLLVAINGLLMLLGLPFSIHTGGDDIKAIISASALSVSVGSVFWFFNRNCEKEIRKRDGYIIVTFGWILISIFGALPYYWSGHIPNYTDAFFETMSGYTTTGASILNDIESIPQGLLFWRSMTHWIGGMGIIVLTVAILPILGIGGMQLFVAEVPGPTPDKLHPRIAVTAKRLWFIYVLFTFVETILLMLGDMSFFDAICHSMATLATGGFSTQNDSAAGFSPYIQYVITFFMILAGINFSLHYHFLKGRLIKLWNNEELRVYIYILGIITFISTLILATNIGNPIEQSFRESIFMVVSIVTTTGFVNADYTVWTPFLMLTFFILMFLGGSAGSTSGGIKVIRFLLLSKNSIVELKRLIHPSAMIPVRLNGKAVKEDIISKILAFFLIYVIIFILGSLIMSLIGLDFLSAIGSVAATLGNIGPGIGSVGPVDNFAHIPTIGKWFLSFLMLLGRLELFTILVLFTPYFWRK